MVPLPTYMFIHTHYCAIELFVVVIYRNKH